MKDKCDTSVKYRNVELK